MASSGRGVAGVCAAAINEKTPARVTQATMNRFMWLSPSAKSAVMRGEKLQHLGKHGRDHRHMSAVRNLYIRGIETSGLQLSDSGLRFSAVKRGIHGTGANDERNPLEALRRIA